MTHLVDGLRRALRAEHEYLDGLFERLLKCAHEDDRESLMPLWSVFERVLLDHIGWEELNILPRYRLDHPADAAAILEDHARFRTLVAEIGVAAELHLLREDMVREMIDLLRSHAMREEGQFHQWAEETVTGPAVDRFVERVRARIRDATDATGKGGPAIFR